MPTDDFREEIEQSAAEGQAFMEEAAPDLSQMQDMEQTAQEDVEIAPNEAPFIPDELASMEDMEETAMADAGAPIDPVATRFPDYPTEAEQPLADVPEIDPAPVLGAMADMEQAARKDLPPERTQAQQVQSSVETQKFHQFEMDYGPAEVNAAGMDHYEAQARHLDVDFMWKRMVTLKLVDLTHLTEQLLAMLERNR